MFEDMLDFANVFPSIPNTITVGCMATLFIIVMKYLTNRFGIPGLKELFASI